MTSPYIEHLLKQTKKLSDNTYGNIFTLIMKNELGEGIFTCNLCSACNLAGESALRTHIGGRKHQLRIQHSYTPDAKVFRAPLSNQHNILIHSRLEPKPPGEDDNNTAIYFKSYSAKNDKPLIGCEYILEIIDQKMKEPLYICVLCDKRCDPRNIMAQVTSHRHRMKYLENHFPSIMNQLNKSEKFNENMKFREEILTKIAKNIESKFGRLQPTVYDYYDYEKNKPQITDLVKNSKHFTEMEMPDYVDDFIKNFKLNDFDEISSSSEEDRNYRMRDVEKKKFSENGNYGKERNTQFELANRVPPKNSGLKNIFKPNLKSSFEMLSFDHSRQKDLPEPSTSKARPFPSAKELSEQSEKKLKDSYTYEKYKITLEIEQKKIEAKYKEFEKSPEKHPDYSDEWKAFWQRRYNELLSKGKDANGHDYKPEWVDFWMPRMRQLKLKELDKKKHEIRSKLKISKDLGDIYDKEMMKKHVNSPKRLRSPSPRRERQKAIEISDESDDSDHSPKRSRKRISRSRSRSERATRSRSSSEEIQDGPINIVTVCRLLLALEYEVGLIAPRILALLESALEMERKEANSSEDLLRDSKNITFLEAVKEKLKGLLSAELLAHSRINPVKKAIRNIAALLHEASKLKPSVPIVEIKQPDPVELAKLEIAKVLTQNLIEQGKTDVSSEELAEIVNEFLKSQMDVDVEENETPPTSSSPPPAPSGFSTAGTSKSSFPGPSGSSKSTSIPSNDDSTLENLTDDDLKTLLRNFSDLTEDEQKHLIRYLEKLEKTHPKRVKMLSKYVDAGDEEIDDGDGETEPPTRKKSPVPFEKLSDDEYDSDDGPDLPNIQKRPNFLNPMNVANDLMNSLMQSQNQGSQQQFRPEWGWESCAIEYYRQNPPNLELRAGYQQPLAAMTVMATPDENLMDNGYNNYGNGGGSSMVLVNRTPRRPERPNNTQLTGKGRNRQN